MRMERSYFLRIRGNEQRGKARSIQLVGGERRDYHFGNKPISFFALFTFAILSCALGASSDFLTAQQTNELVGMRFLRAVQRAQQGRFPYSKHSFYLNAASNKTWRFSMDLQTKLDFALKPPVAEAVTQEDLKQLFETNAHPKHYIGFEISGLLHVGSLLVSGSVINNLSAAGVETTVFLADWHSIINNKLGGDEEKIREASKYYEEAFRFYCPKAKIVRGVDLYRGNGDYWKSVLKFSMHVTLARATRTMQVLGRSESETLDVAKYIYPSMQAVDIHFLKADIAHAGMDQRKVHMLAREVFPKMGWKPPIALHHHLLPSLLGSELKMSKSKPESAVFIHDLEEEIRRKINKAFCPETTEGNPVLEYARFLVFGMGSKKEFEIERPEKYGGNISFGSFEELETAFASKKLHAGDLKAGVADALNELVSPVRKHFEKGKAGELLEKMKG